jgi:hypothetical protein
MAFFGWIKNSFSIIWETLKSIKKYPILLLPIFINWILLASFTIYLTYYFEFPDDTTLIFVISFLILWFVSFSLTFTSAIMVTLVRQIETNWKINFFDALSITSSRVLPLLWLSLIWAILWFVIIIIEAILSKSKKSNDDKNISYESVSRTLWWDSKFSWFSLWLDVLKDLLRLSVFLSVPSILWRKKWTFWAIWEWMKIIWKHPWEFLWIFGSMFLIWILMWIPLAVIFTLSDKWVEFPDWVWILTIIYEWIMWTFYIYMEQMSATLLYLWHYKWVTMNKKASDWKRIDFKDVKKPSLIDDLYEFTWKKVEN